MIYKSRCSSRFKLSYNYTGWLWSFPGLLCVFSLKTLYIIILKDNISFLPIIGFSCLIYFNSLFAWHTFFIKIMTLLKLTLLDMFWSFIDHHQLRVELLRTTKTCVVKFQMCRYFFKIVVSLLLSRSFTHFSLTLSILVILFFVLL